MGNSIALLKVGVHMRTLIESWVNEFIRIIDLKFCTGYSKAHPEAVTSFLQAFTTNFQTSKITFLLEEKQVY